MESTLDTPAPPSLGRKAPLVFAVLGLLAYYNSFAGTYLLDDNWWVLNQQLNEFSSDGELFRARPLVSLSLTTNYHLSGINVRSYHLFNLIVHCAAGLCLFGILRRTLLLPRWNPAIQQKAEPLALLIAILWMVHPLQTQAVTYIIQRCESMMGLFYLLSLYCFIRGMQTANGKHWPWYLGTVASLVLGLGCKEIIVTAPLMILLYDWIMLNQTWRDIVRRRWGLYLILGGISLAFMVRMVGQSLFTPSTVGFQSRYTPWEYLSTQPGVLLHYLRLSVWPTPQCFDYSDWPVAQNWMQWVLPGIVVLALLGGTIWLCVRRHWAGFLGAWFFVILAPTSSIVPVLDMAFEHRMYLSLAAILCLLVLGAEYLLGQMLVSASDWPTLQRYVPPGVAIGVVLVLTVWTVNRNGDYLTPERMWQDVHQKRPDNIRAKTSLAEVHLSKGELKQAADLCNQALQVENPSFGTILTLAETLEVHGQIKEAIALYEQLVVQWPGHSLAHFFFAWALLEDGQNQRAAQEFEAAIAANAARAEFWWGLGLSLERMQKTPESRAAYARSLEIDKQWPITAIREGRSLLLHEKVSKRNATRALLIAQASVQAQPEPTAAALDLLAIALSQNGRYQDAAQTAEQAQQRATQQGNVAQAQQIAQRSKLYRNNKPYGYATRNLD